jgi:hypothetical protein
MATPTPTVRFNPPHVQHMRELSPFTLTHTAALHRFYPHTSQTTETIELCDGIIASAAESDEALLARLRTVVDIPKFRKEDRCVCGLWLWLVVEVVGGVVSE